MPRQAAATNRRPSSVHSDVDLRSELDGLRGVCRRQAHVIDTLGEAVSALRRGAVALKAENAELRARNDEQQGEALELRLPLDVRAPGAARLILARSLGDGVAPLVLERAKLVISELVTNAVCHSAAPGADAVVVRIELAATTVQLEVEDPGRDGTVAPHSPDLNCGGGFGLHIVQRLSERWGFERIAAGGTRVWAQLARAPVAVPSNATAAVP